MSAVVPESSNPLIQAFEAEKTEPVVEENTTTDEFDF